MSDKLEQLLIESIQEAAEVLATTDSLQSKLVQLELLNSYSYNLVEYYKEDEEEIDESSKIVCFLVSKGVLDKFITNRRERPLNSPELDLLEYMDEFGETPRVIMDAFKWEHTPEGISFWEKLSLEFIEEFDNL